MYSEYLMLLLILALGIIGHNTTVAYAVIIVLVLKLLGLTVMLDILSVNGLNWGIVLLLAAILVPIATGDVTIANMIDALKASIMLAMVTSPVAIGTIIGVCFFKGVAVGPLIAGGMTYALMKLFASIK